MCPSSTSSSDLSIDGAAGRRNPTRDPPSSSADGALRSNADADGQGGAARALRVSGYAVFRHERSGRTCAARGEAFRFAARFLAFVAPLLAFLGVVEFRLWSVGDTRPIALVVQKQQSSQAEIIYSRGHLSDQYGVYKVAGIRRTRPRIVVLGSSRVYTIRSFMFAPHEEHFYNAGGAIQNAYDLVEFARLIERGRIPRPELVVLGLDPWWIKAGLGEQSWLNDRDEAFRPGIQLATLLTTARSMASNLSFRVVEEAKGDSSVIRLGSVARRTDSGFRKDGSFQYWPEIYEDFLQDMQYRDRVRPPIVWRVQNLFRQFELPTELDPERVRLIVDALAHMRRMGIEVVVLQLPFASDALSALDQSEPHRALWSFYVNELEPLLTAEGVQVVSVLSPQDLALVDAYMIDGYHAGEVLSAEMILQAYRQAPAGSLMRSIAADDLARLVETAEVPLLFSVPEGLRTDGR
jgi:hypothetical protein